MSAGVHGDEYKNDSVECMLLGSCVVGRSGWGYALGHVHVEKIGQEKSGWYTV